LVRCSAEQLIQFHVASDSQPVTAKKQKIDLGVRGRFFVWSM